MEVKSREVGSTSSIVPDSRRVEVGFLVVADLKRMKT